MGFVRQVLFVRGKALAFHTKARAVPAKLLLILRDMLKGSSAFSSQERLLKMLAVVSSLLGYVPTTLVVLLVVMVLPVLRVAVSADLLPSEPVER
jgi:hypothetical protein